MTVITGIAYPLLITGIAQLIYPWKANGSIVLKDGKNIGSKLIGQKFDTVIYFSSRPSATDYNPLPSGGTNYGLTNSILKENVTKRKEHFLEFNHLDSTTNIPAEMVFSSGSGLDPHISPLSALYQADRVAMARNFNNEQKKQLMDLINKLSESPQFMYFGENRINVLLLNIETDKIK